MIVSTIYATDKIYRLLKGANLNISGDVYNGRFPVDEMMEDIVVNALPITGQEVQTVIVNVNIYIPNISVNYGAKEDFTLPNLTRIDEVIQNVANVLNSSHDPSYLATVQAIGNPMLEMASKRHFVNIRVQLQIFNF